MVFVCYGMCKLWYVQLTFFFILQIFSYYDMCIDFIFYYDMSIQIFFVIMVCALFFCYYGMSIEIFLLIMICVFFYYTHKWYVCYEVCGVCGSFQRDVPTVLHHKNLPTYEQVISIGDLTMFMQGRNYPLIRYLKNITKILNHLWVILKFSLRLFPQNNYLLK